MQTVSKGLRPPTSEIEIAAALCKPFEGLRLAQYKCPAGKDTIGYGHVIQAWDKFVQPITEAQAEALLRKDLTIANAWVHDLVKIPLTVNQYASLTSLVMNIGGDAFADSTLLKKLRAGDTKAIPAEIKRWNKATVNGKLVILAGLVARRNAEAYLFQKS